MRMIHLLYFIALLLTNNSFAATVYEPIHSLESQPVAGKDSNGNPRTFLLDTTGRQIEVEASGTTINGKVTVSSAGATDRTQGTTATVNSCTFIPSSSNTGLVYVGGSTVTNASGANPGIPLGTGGGSALSDISTTNLNNLYFASDNASDIIYYLCN